MEKNDSGRSRGSMVEFAVLIIVVIGFSAFAYEQRGDEKSITGRPIGAGTGTQAMGNNCDCNPAKTMVKCGGQEPIACEEGCIKTKDGDGCVGFCMFTDCHDECLPGGGTAVRCKKCQSNKWEKEITNCNLCEEINGKAICTIIHSCIAETYHNEPGEIGEDDIELCSDDCGSGYHCDARTCKCIEN